MAWLVVILLLLVALGNLFDFLIGPPGQRRLKDRLVEWYVVIAGGKWTGIVQSSARTMNLFLNHLLGITNISTKGVLRASIIGTILMFSVLVISLGIHFPFIKFMASDRKVLLWNSFNIFCVVVANVALDVISLFLTRYVIRKLEQTSTNGRLLLLLLFQGIVIYILVATVMTLTESVMLVFSGGAFIGLQANIAEKLVMVRNLFFNLFPLLLRNPWKHGRGMKFGETSLLIFGAIAAVPLIFSILILLASWTLQISRRLTQRPLALLLERLEGSPKGLFTTICVGLSVIAGLLAALAKALQ